MCVIALPKHRLGRFSHNPEFPSERAGTGSEDLGLSLRPEFLEPSQAVTDAKAPHTLSNEDGKF